MKTTTIKKTLIIIELIGLTAAIIQDIKKSKPKLTAITQLKPRTLWGDLYRVTANHNGTYTTMYSRPANEAEYQASRMSRLHDGGGIFTSTSDTDGTTLEGNPTFWTADARYTSGQGNWIVYDADERKIAALDDTEDDD